MLIKINCYFMIFESSVALTYLKMINISIKYRKIELLYHLELPNRQKLTKNGEKTKFLNIILPTALKFQKFCNLDC